MEKRKIICPKCKSRLKKVEVKVHGAKEKVVSYQCPKCDYFEFENGSSNVAALLSEPVLAREWDTEEEDEAWKHL